MLFNLNQTVVFQQRSYLFLSVDAGRTFFFLLVIAFSHENSKREIHIVLFFSMKFFLPLSNILFLPISFWIFKNISVLIVVEMILFQDSYFLNNIFFSLLLTTFCFLKRLTRLIMQFIYLCPQFSSYILFLYVVFR